ncbi:leucine-rich melanocyte differentiation-associated protein-like isoform X2 [Zootermopsis nevadensis]|uniref:leucine-rich melanocyte differentiation-associated protein-like isoform X2 n=1 Tax=Zootermopsis nevadensis TaxID=136037 RepID=UPI000B8EDAA4|nr:leucine-rich melanocyte differentiation-associated protein-like isoform X2 [Zootermopsis nevadensis]
MSYIVCALYFQLSYVGQDCWKIPPVLVQMYGTKVQFLDLSFNCLMTLQGVEMFPNLEELVLDNNKLSDSVLVPQLPNLHILSLNKNNISNLESLLTKIAKNLPSLHYLSLLGNAACPNQLSDADKDEEDYQRYRFYVLYHLPRLKFLDSRCVTSEEWKEAQHRGKFMKIIRPESSHVSHRSDTCGGSPPSTYTPLPTSSRCIGDHQGAYGKCRYRYSGKHSEGNRFIQNSDL